MNLKTLFKKKNKSEDPEFIVTPKKKSATLGDFKIGTTIRSLFFFLLTVSPIAIYAYIIYNSTGLEIYKESNIWNYMSVPNAHYIFSLFWAGMGLLIVTFLMICLYGVFTWLVTNKKWQTTYVFAVIIAAAVGVLLTALSQYFYAKFFDFYLYEAQTGVNGGSSLKQKWAKDISDKLTIDYYGTTEPKKGQKPLISNIFDWMTSAVVWWVMFVQFMFLFGIGISLQNALIDKNNLNDYEKYISDAKQDESGVDFNKVNRFFRSMFKNNDKNTAKFLIVISLVIVIPNLVYSIIGTVSTSHMQSVIAWSYKVPALLKDYNLDASNPIFQINNDLNASKYGSIFTVLSLQIILEGLTIATLFFFITMLLRGKNVSNRIFIVESIILFIELVALVSVSLASKIYVYRLTDFWQTSANGQTNIGEYAKAVSVLLGDDFSKLTDMFDLNGIDTVSSIHIEWLDKVGSIAESIIAYAWILGCFAIVTYNIDRLGYFKKANSVTYESGIFNS